VLELVYPAISRRRCSLPADQAVRCGVIRGKVFHQGSGRLNNPDKKLLGKHADCVTEYDPTYGPDDRFVLRNRDHDAAFSSYVFNVIPPGPPLIEAVDDLYYTLKPQGGRAFVAVRSWEVVELVKKDTWVPFLEGYKVPRGKRKYTYQRGYTVDDLCSLCTSGARFSDIQVVSAGRYTAVILET